MPPTYERATCPGCGRTVPARKLRDGTLVTATAHRTVKHSNTAPDCVPEGTVIVPAPAPAPLRADVTNVTPTSLAVQARRDFTGTDQEFIDRYPGWGFVLALTAMPRRPQRELVGAR